MYKKVNNNFFDLLVCFSSGLVLNSAVLSSTVRPAVTEELDPPVQIVLSVSNVSTNVSTTVNALFARKRNDVI